MPGTLLETDILRKSFDGLNKRQSVIWAKLATLLGTLGKLLGFQRQALREGFDTSDNYWMSALAGWRWRRGTDTLCGADVPHGNKNMANAQSLNTWVTSRRQIEDQSIISHSKKMVNAPVVDPGTNITTCTVTMPV